MLFRQPFRFLAAALFVSPVVALADSTLIFSETQGSGAPTEMAVEITDGKMRMGEATESGWGAFDAANKTVMFVEPDRKSYMVMNQQKMGEMAGMHDQMMQQMMAQMQQAQAGMSPEQAAQMQAMMGQYGMPTAQVKQPPKRAMNALGKKGQVAGIDCEMYESNSQRGTTQYCLAGYEKVGMSKGEYETLQAFQALMSSMSDKMGGGDMLGDVALADGKVPLSVTRASSQGLHTTQFVRREGGQISADRFNAPQGYKQENPFQGIQH